MAQLKNATILINESVLVTCDKFSENTSKADPKLKIEVKYSRKMYLNCSKVVPVMMKKIFLEIKTGKKTPIISKFKNSDVYVKALK